MNWKCKEKMMFFPKTLTVTGPTATGKTMLAVRLARAFDGEIVSVDSRQVFRGMDLGTGKDLDEYGEIPFHLIDVAEPDADYDLFHFVGQARAVIRAIAERGRLPILCGGSTLYLDALLHGYRFSGAEPDPVLRAELDALPLAALHARLDELAPDFAAGFKDRDNPLRVRRAIENVLAGARPDAEPDFEGILDSTLVLGVYFPRPEVHERIERRLDARLAAGMIDEVRLLHDVRRVSWEKLERFGLEYRWIAEFLQGRLDRQAMRDTLLAKIRQFAKRQDIWFRKMEREGVPIYWVERGNFDTAQVWAAEFLAGRTLPAPRLRISEIFYGARQPRD